MGPSVGLRPAKDDPRSSFACQRVVEHFPNDFFKLLLLQAEQIIVKWLVKTEVAPAARAEGCGDERVEDGVGVGLAEVMWSVA